MTEPPSAPIGEPAQTKRAWTARRIAALVLTVYVVLFIVFNTHRVTISFVFFSVRTLTLIALAVVAVLSFGVGYLVHGRRAKARSR